MSRKNPRLFYGRALCGGLVAVALGGCTALGGNATPPAEPASVAGPPSPVAAQPAPPMPVPRPRPTARETKPVPEIHAQHEKLIPIDPRNLIGMDTQGVQKLLGAPLRVKNDELSREWVYASAGCSFRVFFYPNLNSAAFRVLKYGGNDDNGALLDVSDVCVRRILTTKANAEN